jgi:hypothetical protein
MAAVVEMTVPRPDRTAGKLVLEAPSGDLFGSHLELYIRTGTLAERREIEPAPRDFLAKVEEELPVADMKKGDNVFVEADVVVKQPAMVAGAISLSGSLTIAGKTASASADVQLVEGKTSGFGSLTWWVRP